MPNLSLFYKLGTSDEDIKKYRLEVLEAQKKSSQTKYLDFLTIYE